MKVWLYYRLSRDEDEELNSLTNQRNIIYEYAVSSGHEVMGESFDDNVSGMHFNREGIEKIYEVVEAGKIEAIIVKDLSRLGRHRTQTALFIDYLREHDVRVISATENIDTFNENDDLIIGFKGLVNDFYARDGSRRVRTGYRQKQKEGIVIIPPIVTRELWQQAQTMLAQRKERNVRAGTDRKILRYSGMLYCEDCGRAMTGKRVKLKESERVMYVCSTYHRYGKEHCPDHQVDESALDEFIMEELKNTKFLYEQNWSTLEQLIDCWIPKAEVTGTQIKKLSEHILVLEEEVEVILMERIRDKANAERYDRMIQKREEEIAAAKKQIEELQNISAVLRERQSKLKRDISMIDDILSEGKMSEAHLRMLVEKIYIHESDGKISLDIRIKAPFRSHTDVYENGELTEQYANLDFGWDRLAPLIYGDYIAG